jgi:hypothetical protein
LNELLVSSGLARIYGTRTPLPDGRDSREYLASAALENEAKAAKRGGSPACSCVSSSQHLYEVRPRKVVAAERSDAGRFIVHADQDLLCAGGLRAFVMELSLKCAVNLLPG